MSFLTEKEELPEKYNEILDKVKNKIKKESIQIFVVIKYQKRVLSALAYL